MTIEYLSFIRFVGRLLLDHSASSSSSFMKSSFLIQMIRWIRGLSRIEFFMFLIAWGIFFEIWWDLDLQMLPSSSSLLMRRASSSSSQSLLKVITSFWHTFLEWMNSMIKVAITTSAFSASSSTASSCSAFWIFTFFNLFPQSHLLIYDLPFRYLG